VRQNLALLECSLWASLERRVPVDLHFLDGLIVLARTEDAARGDHRVPRPNLFLLLLALLFMLLRFGRVRGAIYLGFVTVDLRVCNGHRLVARRVVRRRRGAVFELRRVLFVQSIPAEHRLVRAELLGTS
ncbi:hypothetical protein PMAYCL1PPCAC_20011, partial [Pristionchus mayeri]